MIITTITIMHNASQHTMNVIMYEDVKAVTWCRW